MLTATKLKFHLLTEDKNMKLALTRIYHPIYHIIDGKIKQGPPPAEITGNLAEITGDLSYITGDLSDITGDLSEISGNLSGIRGDITDCELTADDRAAGIDAACLVR